MWCSMAKARSAKGVTAKSRNGRQYHSTGCWDGEAAWNTQKLSEKPWVKEKEASSATIFQGLGGPAEVRGDGSGATR